MSANKNATELINQNTCANYSSIETNSTFSEFFGGLFSTEHWPDRWHCGNWSDTEGWLYIFSDSLIFTSYLAIPIILIYFLRKIKLGKLAWLFALMACFILLCGFTHLIDVILFWWPVYRLSGFIKLLTGIVSFITAIVLAFIIPKALKFKSPEIMQKEINERIAAQKKFELFIKHSPGAIAMFDLDMNYVMANDNWYRDYKLEGQEIIGKSHYEIFPEILEMPHWLDLHKRAMNGETLKNEFDHLTNNKEETYLRWEICPWRNADDSIGGIMMFTQVITNEFKLKKDLEEQEKLTRKFSNLVLEISETAKIGFWEVDFISNGVFWSDEVYEIHEMEKGTKINLDEGLNFYHPDHRNTITEAVNTSIAKKSNWDLQLKIITKKNKDRWVRTIGGPNFNKENEMIGLRGLIMNIDKNIQYEQELKELNHSLETIVEQTKTELISTQKHIIESEKMASLGQLVAGIAHEINTPMGAIKSSAENLKLVNQNIIENIPSIANIFNSQKQQYLYDILSDTSQEKISRSTKEEREIKRQIKLKLNNLNIEEKEKIGDIIVNLGYLDVFEKRSYLFEIPDILEVFSVATLFHEQKKISRIIKKSAESCAKIVYSLKSFSKLENYDSIIETDLHKDFENVLNLYKHQIKQGVNVLKKFKEGNILVDSYGDSLVQVWSNLISNALHAMMNNGTLTITTKMDAEEITVMVSDTGAGIPIEVQDKIFNPFFTTKQKGQGTGLGLDIVKKIIEKHKGTITFESKPGKTTFIVKLPKKNKI